uniref:Regulatory protein zeste n=1 Tax=Diabrotica virgifera virgifera TaxID=50390 RepID=A0A6P7F9Q4_DIAVI
MSTRPAPKQWEILLDSFESKPEMVSGRASGPNAKHIIRNKWESLATQLNSLGYTNKPVEKWIKTWTDFKSALKKKAAEIKREQTGTGGGPPSGKQLTSYEERALKLLGNSFIGLNMPEAGVSPFLLLSNPKHCNQTKRL